MTKRKHKWYSRKALILQIERNNAELAGLRNVARQVSKDIQALMRLLRDGMP